MSETSFTGRSTCSVHQGEERFKADGSLTNPIFQTSTFVFENLEEYRRLKAGQQKSFEYGRYGNPTQQVAEAKLAALDGGEAALLFPSGMSAVTSTLLALLESGQHLIAIEDCYRMTTRFCQYLDRFGVETSLVRPGDFQALSEAVRPDTQAILVESPSNLHLRVSDFDRLAFFSREHQLKLIVDSTFGSPVNQRPLEAGADLVIHSATKYLGGHNDLLAGSVCGAGELVEKIREFRNISGAIPSPHTCYLLIRGLKTLALRVRHQNDSGLRIARYLEAHPKVRQVYYPGLETHPDHEVARRQMEGFGGVVSFELDGDRKQVERFVQTLRIPHIGPSFGGPEALVTYPAVVSFYDVEYEERMAKGITDQLIRYAAGLEDPEDLLADIDQALAQV